MYLTIAMIDWSKPTVNHSPWKCLVSNYCSFKKGGVHKSNIIKYHKIYAIKICWTMFWVVDKIAFFKKMDVTLFLTDSLIKGILLFFQFLEIILLNPKKSQILNFWDIILHNINLVNTKQIGQQRFTGKKCMRQRLLRF